MAKSAAEETFMRAIGERLQLLERMSGAESAVDFASQIGASKQNWSNYTSGKIYPPYMLLRQLRDRFGCTLDWILIGTESGTADFIDRLHKIRQTRPRSLPSGAIQLVLNGGTD